MKSGATRFLAVRCEQIYNFEHTAVPDRNFNVREANCNSRRFNPAPVSGNSVTGFMTTSFGRKRPSRLW
jgi:hypothetical protein